MGVRTFKDQLCPLANTFVGEVGLTVASHLLLDANAVFPRRCPSVVRKLHRDFHIGLAPGGQAPDLGQPSALADGLL